MIGFANPNRPMCEGCGDECPEECMSCILPDYCAICAIPRIAIQVREQAEDFQALSAEWFQRAS